jgi:hypothetical protein
LTPTHDGAIVAPVKYPPAYKAAVAMQRVILADCLKVETDIKLKPTLARAYKELEELKLRIRMKPAPKPIDVSKPKQTGIPSVE